MFIKNKIYSRSKIHDKYGGNRQRGISNCVNHPYIFIFTKPKKEQDVYIDKWENDYFYYSGEGRIGDMTITGGNRSIYNHEVNGKEIHLFEKTNVSGQWKYIDQLKLVDMVSYQNEDDNGDLRNSIQFVLISTNKETDTESQFPDIDNEKNYNYNTPNVTERKGLVTSRVGQGLYRKNILNKWDNKCSVTGYDNIKILISSHIVPWRESNKKEKYDVDNGLLLSPDLDGLFDKNFISFGDDGKIIFSNLINIDELKVLGINEDMSLRFVNEGMKKYLKRHRDNLKND
tara:strand:+ start:270 stop:1130 length:861 start_codon:yes stop_codon:yes gene_type:complete